MKEIKNKFNKLRSECSEKGDYIILCEVIKGQNYKNIDIRKSFLNLVSRDEYPFDERDEYIDYLYVQNKK